MTNQTTFTQAANLAKKSANVTFALGIYALAQGATTKSQILDLMGYPTEGRKTKFKTQLSYAGNIATRIIKPIMNAELEISIEGDLPETLTEFAKLGDGYLNGGTITEWIATNAPVEVAPEPTPKKTTANATKGKNAPSNADPIVQHTNDLMQQTAATVAQAEKEFDAFMVAEELANQNGLQGETKTEAIKLAVQLLAQYQVALEQASAEPAH